MAVAAVSRACWLYAIVERILVVACQDSPHIIRTTGRTTKKLTMWYGSWWFLRRLPRPLICRSRRTTRKPTIRGESWWLLSVNHQIIYGNGLASMDASGAVDAEPCNPSCLVDGVRSGAVRVSRPQTTKESTDQTGSWWFERHPCPEPPRFCQK